ncbi:unnamed protein product [Rotaria sordida]|uniref:Nuclear receptor domain-containing protein n=1 Tax=Rotaria sordida TaxID=392033 RepID=A0A813X1Q0_9BILA|nr:unnamed protein product [Rotaria sordida]CAF1367466.1 unnamed protein product [Rotaria sordida]CAF1370695.1 unnamed protein product [Rotaria sordida]
MATAMNFNQHQMMIITSDDRIIDQIEINNHPSSFETVFSECERNINRLPPYYNQSTNHRKTKNTSLICAICGSLALGRNFGVITCESCKIFFRRNALKNSGAFCCRHNNACEITFNTRRHCSACRLAKCLINGMKRDRLLKAEEKAKNRHMTKENQNFISQTNNKIYKQRSELRSSTFPNHFLTSNTTNMISTGFTEFLPQSSFQSNQKMLSLEDIQCIEAVQIAFEKRIELAARDGLPWNPSVYATTLLQYINSHSVPAMHLLTFFKQIPEFNQLNVNDKLILTKYNLLSLFIINSALLYKIDTKQFREIDIDVPWNLSILRTIHGNENCLQMKKIFRSFVHIKFYDYKIIQLSLIVLFLTKGLSTGDGVPEPILNDNMAVYRAQNYYIELLWKYMEIIHGFKQAFRIYNKIIRRFLIWQKLEKNLRHDIEQNLSKTDENELLPLMKSLLHIS